jgi:hypothetical protein
VRGSYGEPDIERFTAAVCALIRTCASLANQFAYPCVVDSDMNEPNHLNDESRNLDLSSLTFDEFAAFFFAREVVPDDE